MLLDILVLGQDLDQPPPFADGLAEMGTKTHVTNLAIIYLQKKIILFSPAWFSLKQVFKCHCGPKCTP